MSVPEQQEEPRPTRHVSALRPAPRAIALFAFTWLLLGAAAVAVALVALRLL